MPSKAFRSVGGFTGGSSLKTWLHTICYRCAIDHVRFEGRRRHLPLAKLTDAPAPTSTSDAALARIDLDGTLDHLDPEVRTLLMLTGPLGISFDEVAEITGVPRGTVASRVSRARADLRRTVQR